VGTWVLGSFYAGSEVRVEQLALSNQHSATLEQWWTHYERGKLAAQYVLEMFPQALASPEELGLADFRETASMGNVLLLLGET